MQNGFEAAGKWLQKSELTAGTMLWVGLEAVCGGMRV